MGEQTIVAKSRNGSPLYVLPVVHIHGLSTPTTPETDACSCGGSSEKCRIAFRGTSSSVRASGYLSPPVSPKRRNRSPIRAEFSPLTSPRSRAVGLGQRRKL